jgi:hypothetical protein
MKKLVLVALILSNPIWLAADPIALPSDFGNTDSEEALAVEDDSPVIILEEPQGTALWYFLNGPWAFWETNFPPGAYSPLIPDFPPSGEGSSYGGSTDLGFFAQILDGMINEMPQKTPAEQKAEDSWDALNAECRRTANQITALYGILDGARDAAKTVAGRAPNASILELKQLGQDLFKAGQDYGKAKGALDVKMLNKLKTAHTTFLNDLAAAGNGPYAKKLEATYQANKAAVDPAGYEKLLAAELITDTKNEILKATNALTQRGIIKSAWPF